MAQQKKKEQNVKEFVRKLLSTFLYVLSKKKHITRRTDNSSDLYSFNCYFGGYYKTKNSTSVILTHVL